MVSGSVELMVIGNKRKKKKKPGGSNIGVVKIDAYIKTIKLTSYSFQEITRTNHPNPALRFCQKVMKKTSSQNYLSLLEFFRDYSTGKITLVDLKIKIVDYFPTFMDDFDRVLEFYGHSKFDGKGKKLPEQQETKIVELTRSYKFLPKHLSGVHESGITKLGEQVLNFCCYSKGSFTDDDDDNRRVKTIDPSEKLLNGREDELFVKDMMKNWMRSTLENATKLSNAINAGQIIKNSTMEEIVNHYFTGYNFRLIAKMYEEAPLMVLDQLRRAPETVLPILIERLNNKLMELESASI